MFLVYIKRNQPYTDSLAIGRIRIRYTTEYKSPGFDMTKDDMITNNNIYEVDTIDEANALAEKLATISPTKEVCIANIVALWQSETPAVRKKVVSEKGVLPA